MRSCIVLALIFSVTLLALVPAPAQAVGMGEPEDGSWQDQIDTLVDTLTPEERVAQLMLVTFEGTYLGQETAIARLITDYSVGGVLLLADHDNINGPINTARLVQSLTNGLQDLAFDAAQATEKRPTPRAYIPLFIATTHGGNDQPATQISLGTTPLPSQMAVGATWEPEYARQVGQIAGSELDAMGVNMLLGPALDVSSQPQTGRTLDLGTTTFGGEPYWVGRMGQAYITGVHEGSSGRIAVVAQHFPGLGFADTQPDQEIPVVPRSLDELSQFDLVPYRAVTGGASDSLARADGLQCANIRYQGETTRLITRPVCIDERAAGQLLAVDDIAAWRDEGGLVVSSPLGTRAMRRYYNLSPFPHRQIAREAFLAGNDLLYIENFGTEYGADQTDNVIDVIKFFAEGYRDDPVFRARVDQSLRRILRLKLDLYNGDFSQWNVQRSPTNIDTVGGASVPLYTIAQRSVTLLAPRRESLPTSPSRDESIVIFTDVRLIQQCSYCAQYALVEFNALERAIERLYGPYAGAQIRPERVSSFSFKQLSLYLEGDIVGATDSQFKTIQRIGEALRDVDWIVFMMLDFSPGWEASTVLRDLLAMESPLLGYAHLVVFALGAPTYLSSTEISKLTAYFGLYSHTPPYIDAAARALFQETTYPGTLPVSVPAVGYDIFEQTAPDPTQVIQVGLAQPDGSAGPVALNQADLFTTRTGERLTLQTQSLRDRNGHIVPDNTPVEFTLTFISDNLQTRQYSMTRDGIAQTSFTPTRPGRIQVTAASRGATHSNVFQIIVEVTEAALTAGPTVTGYPATPALTLAVPTGTPASLPGGIALNSPATPINRNTPEPAGGAMVSNKEDTASARRLDLTDFVTSIIGLVLMSALSFAAGLSATYTMDGGVRGALGSIVAGLTGYIYYGIGGPGAAEIARWAGDLAPALTTLGAGLVGMVYAWLTLRNHHRA